MDAQFGALFPDKDPSNGSLPAKPFSPENCREGVVGLKQTPVSIVLITIPDNFLIKS